MCAGSNHISSVHVIKINQYQYYCLDVQCVTPTFLRKYKVVHQCQAFTVFYLYFLFPFFPLLGHSSFIHFILSFIFFHFAFSAFLPLPFPLSFISLLCSFFPFPLLSFIQCSFLFPLFFYSFFLRLSFLSFLLPFIFLASSFLDLSPSSSPFPVTYLPSADDVLPF